MRREQAIRLLSSEKEFLHQQYGVTKLGLFGSVARDEAGNESDVDVVVEMSPDLFMMVHLKESLEELFHCPVDLIRYREQMNGFLKRRIEQDVIYV